MDGQGHATPPPPCQDINGDGESDSSDAVYFLQWQFLGGPAPVCPVDNGEPMGLPDTGRNKCYEPFFGEVVDCSSDTCAGQDGFYQTGCSNEGRFTDNGDGTVTDNCTGLMWQKDTGNDGNSLDWCHALDYCESLELAGRTDWRLPNVRELLSILDYGRHHPAIDPVFGALPSSYRSSTSVGGDPVYAWIVDFSSGDVYGVHKGTGSLFVRAVRTIQPGE